MEAMVKITAAEVNKLRKATGAGMMDCKKALVEAEGDFDKVAKVAKLQTNPTIKVKVMDENFGILGNQRQIVRCLLSRRNASTCRACCA